MSPFSLSWVLTLATKQEVIGEQRGGAFTENALSTVPRNIVSTLGNEPKLEKL